MYVVTLSTYEIHHVNGHADMPTKSTGLVAVPQATTTEVDTISREARGQHLKAIPLLRGWLNDQNGRDFLFNPSLFQVSSHPSINGVYTVQLYIISCE